MKELTIKYYEDGTEFIDDMYSDEIEKGLSKEEFYDFIYYDFDSTKLEIDNKLLDITSAHLIKLTSGEIILVNNDRMLYSWYEQWCNIVENI